jgi:tetratricopeptide (TPR) repeat protein
MSHERPEDKWKREKQYQAPAPGQPNPPADEAQWMQEKQGRVAARPNQPQNPQEQQWMREKQGGQAQPPQPNPNGQPSGQEQQWMREKQGAPAQPSRPTGQPGGQPSGQEAQWMQEKRGGAPPATPEQQWMREKQGNFGGQPNQYQGPAQGAAPPTIRGPVPGSAAGRDQWMREKQGPPPQTTQPGPQPTNRTPGQDELAWHQEKNFTQPNSGKKAKSGNGKLYLILGVVAVLVVAAIVVVVILLLGSKNPSNPTATATAGATTAATSNTTAAATTGSAAGTTAPVTTAPTTEVASTTPAATTSSAGDSARLLSLAQDAANNSRWQDVVNSLELLAPSDPNFSKAKPLLVKAYVELGKQAVAVKTNSQASANLALTNFRKAIALDPNFEGLAKDLQRADTYAQGLLQYQSELYSQAVDTIKPLYDESQLQTEGTHYRNTADILYDSYLKQGDKVFNASNADALAQARNFYSLALAVDAPNKDEANSKLQQVTAALKLLSATPKK